MAVVTLSNFKTFAEWSKLGYKITKGSRATWVDDVAMFAEQQVSRSVKPVYGNHFKDCAPKGTSPHWMQEDYEYDDSPDAYGFFYS
jgi:hypothetical protein